MEGYFKVLESVELGYMVEPKVAAYHAIWEHLKNGETFHPTSVEAAICRGFQIWDDYPDELALCICLDINAVGVRPTGSGMEAYEIASDFAEYTKIQLKDYFDYALPIFQEMHRKPVKKGRRSRKA